MTRTIDPKRRLVLPDHFNSGDVVNIETEGEDVLIVRRVKAAERHPHKMPLAIRAAIKATKTQPRCLRRDYPSTETL